MRAVHQHLIVLISSKSALYQHFISTDSTFNASVPKVTPRHGAHSLGYSPKSQSNRVRRSKATTAAASPVASFIMACFINVTCSEFLSPSTSSPSFLFVIARTERAGSLVLLVKVECFPNGTRRRGRKRFRRGTVGNVVKRL